MYEHELLSPHATKALEYILAVTYLLLFVPFWRYVNGVARPSRVGVRVRAALGWFQVPDDVWLHPGHAWARLQGGRIAVGMDDFAHKLVGPLSAVRLPQIGEHLRCNQRMVSLSADGKTFHMVSPVDGLVVAVNEEVCAAPEDLGRDPYGAGWLLKVEPTDFGRDVKSLVCGEAARHFLQTVAERLGSRLTPELGVLAQDGGTPVHGIARDLDPERWDEVVRSFFEANGGRES